MNKVLDRDSCSLIDQVKLVPNATVSNAPETELDSEKAFREREAWDSIIDDKLIDWGKHPEQFDDEEIESPSRDVVAKAVKAAVLCRDHGMPAPASVCPDAQGGLVFEMKAGPNHVTAIHVWDDLDVECQLFFGTKLVERFSLDLDS